MRNKGLLIVVLVFISHNIFGQLVKPNLPQIDSCKLEYSGSKVDKKSCFYNGIKVYQVSYSKNGKVHLPNRFMLIETDSILWLPYNDRNELFIYDSIFTRFETDFFKDKTYRILKYRDRVLLKDQTYKLIDPLSLDFSQVKKYKIGIWTYYDNRGNKTRTINYDKVNLKKGLKNQSKPILTFKQKADSVLIATFGKDFYKNHIVFNYGKTKYSTDINSQYSDPYGSIFVPLDSIPQKDVVYVDYCYDFLIGDKRFDIIRIRMKTKMGYEIEASNRKIGKKSFYYEGLVKSKGNAVFSDSIMDLNAFATSKGFNINSPSFSIDLEWETTSGIYGDLKLVF